MADSLTEGPYFLRYIAPGTSTQDSNAVYATRVDGTGNPITVNQKTAELVDTETWWPSKAAGENTWFITSSGPLPKGAGHGPVRLGFNNGVVKQGTPINYAVASGFYIIKPAGNDEYIIAIASTGDAPAGVEYVVGATGSGARALEIQEIKAPAEEQPSVPKWSFQKAK
ncbi:hypothetical protein FRC07_000692 [Ceratobasidium sp. 392]|nr:hypothetical protein FRC07_000692 [Ceratobasidium sp. 392]